jgi:hypothetical protein
VARWMLVLACADAASAAAYGWGDWLSCWRTTGCPACGASLRCKAIAPAWLNEIVRGTYFQLESLLTLTEEVDNAWDLAQSSRVKDGEARPPSPTLPLSRETWRSQGPELKAETEEPTLAQRHRFTSSRGTHGVRGYSSNPPAAERRRAEHSGPSTRSGETAVRRR